MNCDSHYHRLCQEPSDINELLPVLRQYGAGCLHITEFGTRFGVSAVGFLAARPKRLVCYDVERKPEVAETLRSFAAEVGVDFQFLEADTREIRIEETDLLFIDTLHIRAQLTQELRAHAPHVRRFIILHDTVTFGEIGEIPGTEGLWSAIIEFLLVNSSWRIIEQRIRNNGLTVLGRL